MHTIVHIESCRFVMTPPPSQPRAKRALLDLAMSFVQKQAGHGSGTAVDIFVVAPCGKVHIPIMELQHYVTHRMGAIPPNQDAFGVSMGGDRFDVKILASIVLNPGEEH